MFTNNRGLVIARISLILVLIMGVLGIMPVQAMAVIHFVKWDAAGANNGTSWGDAFTDLQSALSAASSGDEVWVAAGIYKPTSGADRTVSFILKNGVAVYGGFVGTETLRTQRDPSTNVTILSGEIGAAGNVDNSYHVVIGGGTDNTAVLDGFTVTAGNADGSAPDDRGGGIYNFGGSPNFANINIRSYLKNRF